VTLPKTGLVTLGTFGLLGVNFSSSKFKGDLESLFFKNAKQCVYLNKRF
jgi:hypothetical protein